MRIQVTQLSEGPGPGEVIVEIKTTTGISEEVVLHGRSIEGDTIDVGHPILQQEDRSLVELPRETSSGLWRVWVPTSSVTA